MAGPGRPAGSLGNRNRPFKAALLRVLEQAGRDPVKLEAVATALLKKAAEGDVSAIREIADRLDGKPAQESHTTITRKSACEIRDDELAAIVAGGAVSEKALN